jgi:hypothetical protein
MMIDMTEDHRVVSATERARIARMGQSLNDGEKRLNGNGVLPHFMCKVFFPSQFKIYHENQINV